MRPGAGIGWNGRESSVVQLSKDASDVAQDTVLVAKGRAQGVRAVQEQGLE